MGYSHERIKRNAKLFYKLNTGSSIAAQVIYIAVVMAASLALGLLVTILSVVMSIFGIVGGVTGSLSLGAVAVFLAVILLFAVLYLAFAMGTYVLFMGVKNWYRNSIYRKTSLSEIFIVFMKGRFWGSLGTVMLTLLYTSLWGLLFVIPGIVKYYSYSQATFIKAENPDIPASRAIELSKIMMDGHKTDLFCLQISFIGWFLLSGLTYNILGIVYVFPYYYAAMAFAYEEIKGDAASRGIINIDEIAGGSFQQNM